MAYLLLTGAVTCLAIQNVCTKQYNVKAKVPNRILYNGLSAIAGLLFFLVSAGFQVEWVAGVVPYAVAWGVAGSICGISMNMALATGPMSLSTLLSSYSLVIPTLYGIIVLKDPIRGTTYIGIALLLISLFWVNIKKEDMRLSLRWAIYMAISFFFNGSTAVIQKSQQLKYNGAYKEEFMIYALSTIALICLPYGLYKAKQIWQTLKECVYAAGGGLANGTANLLIMTLQGMLPNAILFPMLSAGSIILMFIAAVVLYKEKLSKPQLAGYLFGILSVIFLNLG